MKTVEELLDEIDHLRSLLRDVRKFANELDVDASTNLGGVIYGDVFSKAIGE